MQDLKQMLVGVSDGGLVGFILVCIPASKGILKTRAQTLATDALIKIFPNGGSLNRQEREVLEDVLLHLLEIPQLVKMICSRKNDEGASVSCGI